MENWIKNHGGLMNLKADQCYSIKELVEIDLTSYKMYVINVNCQCGNDWERVS